MITKRKARVIRRAIHDYNNDIERFSFNPVYNKAIEIIVERRYVKSMMNLSNTFQRMFTYYRNTK